jgi:hypothetical protein
VAGHFPILGTQMLYFSDPVLAKRAEVAPPTKLFAIEQGKAVDQRPADRTQHVISRPETVAPDESDLTPMERGFEAERRRQQQEA